jgi:hypothetical protein
MTPNDKLEGHSRRLKTYPQRRSKRLLPLFKRRSQMPAFIIVITVNIDIRIYTRSIEQEDTFTSTTSASLSHTTTSLPIYTMKT